MTASNCCVTLKVVAEKKKVVQEKGVARGRLEVVVAVVAFQKRRHYGGRAELISKEDDCEDAWTSSSSLLSRRACRL